MASTSFTLSSNQINGREFPNFSPPHIRRSLRISASYATAERTGVASYASQTASFYEVLGIRTGATCQEIKSAYRSLARVLHPDVACGGASAEEFMRVHAAYSTLSDPEKRAAYDGSILRRTRAAVGVVSADGGYSDGSRRRRTWETDQCW
ncbi:hypothetical protein CASFOL_015955 [Castilleja foliolosa]|uniref:J domain-containing protein n=1 Tax=Castilleja foliolosa TaxID=1961234 RepID=A0ABD3DH46_9LAMI